MTTALTARGRVAMLLAGYSPEQIVLQFLKDNGQLNEQQTHDVEVRQNDFMLWYELERPPSNVV